MTRSCAGGRCSPPRRRSLWHRARPDHRRCRRSRRSAGIRPAGPAPRPLLRSPPGSRPAASSRCRTRRRSYRGSSSLAGSGRRPRAACGPTGHRAGRGRELDRVRCARLQPQPADAGGRPVAAAARDGAEAPRRARVDRHRHRRRRVRGRHVHVFGQVAGRVREPGAVRLSPTGDPADDRRIARVHRRLVISGTKPGVPTVTGVRFAQWSLGTGERAAGRDQQTHHRQGNPCPGPLITRDSETSAGCLRIRSAAGPLGPRSRASGQAGSGTATASARPPEPQKNGPAVGTQQCPTRAAPADLERLRCMRHLDHAVWRAIAQPAANGRRCRTFDEFLGSPIPVVDEEAATCGCQAFIDERPERGEAFERNVREPKSEKDNVITAVRPPREHIGKDRPDPSSSPTSRGRSPASRERRRRPSRRGVLQQPRRPRPRSAGKLEHIAGGREAVQRSL